MDDKKMPYKREIHCPICTRLATTCPAFDSTPASHYCDECNHYFTITFYKTP